MPFWACPFKSGRGHHVEFKKRSAQLGEALADRVFVLRHLRTIDASTRKPALSTSAPVAQPNAPAVLVTGCAGFIGWKVCELLLSTGQTIIGLDNLNDAYDIRLKEWRLAQLQAQPQFHFLRADITDRAALDRLLDTGPMVGSDQPGSTRGRPLFGRKSVDLPRYKYHRNAQFARAMSAIWDIKIRACIKLQSLRYRQPAPLS